MRKLTAVLVILASLSAFAAEPSSIEVREGLLVDKDGTEFTVNGGLYLNQTGWDQVVFVVQSLEEQNGKLIAGLKTANVRIASGSASIAGLPTWASVVISAALSILTATVGFFVVREAASKGG